MEFVRRSWAQVRTYLDRLSRAEKALIVSLLLLGLIAVSWMVWWAGSPERIPIPLASGQSEQVLGRLKASGIDAMLDGGEVTVPLEARYEAIAILVQNDLLNENPADAWREMAGKQSPWQTDKQRQSTERVALQDFSSQVIRRMPGVRSAFVVISPLPEDRFGEPNRNPSAAVTIMTLGHRGGKTMVEAVASMISGAVGHGMTQSDVAVVIDGQNWTIGDADERAPTEALEMARVIERDTQEKIERVLDYIKGVKVAVNVKIDPVLKKVEQSIEYLKDDTLASEEEEEFTRSDRVNDGEPGVRSNARADIAGSLSTTGSDEQRTSSKRIYNSKPIVRDSKTVFTGHGPYRVNVTVNVPRGYFARLYKTQNPDAEGEPTDADLEPIRTSHLGAIEAQVEPLIEAEVKGVVVASMIPDAALLYPGAVAAAPTGLTAMIQSEWATPVGVSLLALLALGIMLTMVRKATTQAPLPSVEELAGLPPELPSDEELVGEADETEPMMAGVEMAEEDLQSRKIAEQISELIKANPVEAGGILGRWVRKQV